jgi:hypothetical protein
MTMDNRDVMGHPFIFVFDFYDRQRVKRLSV